MFEFEYHQAAGLRAAPSKNAPAVVMPVASTARPGQAYEVLCTMAAQLNAAGREAVIVDGSAIEAPERRSRDGSHLGLEHALQDPSIGGLGAPGASGEWLVMPAAIGLQTLLQTARAGGAVVALSRLLAPFAGGTVVLLYAPAATLGALFAGVQAQAVVPVLAMPQATIDAYGSLKTLHAAGLWPVLAPMDGEPVANQAPLAQVVRSVSDCAQRYLNFSVEEWPMATWGRRAQEAALAAPRSQGTAFMAPSTQPAADWGGPHAALATRWS